MVLVTIPNINIPLSEEVYTALQRMKVELAAKTRGDKEKGRYTWTDFFETVLRGEGEVAVEFHNIDGDNQVNRHVVLFSLGNYSYEFRGGKFFDKPQQVPRKIEKVLIRT